MQEKEKSKCPFYLDKAKHEQVSQLSWYLRSLHEASPSSSFYGGLTTWPSCLLSSRPSKLWRRPTSKTVSLPMSEFLPYSISGCQDGFVWTWRLIGVSYSGTRLPARDCWSSTRLPLNRFRDRMWGPLMTSAGSTE